MVDTEKDRFQKFLDTLNETQRKSVLSDAKTLQILAGPGSGKTRVLTSRVAYFVVERGIYPGHIIVVTFTNKAANEMKERLNYLIGEKKTSQLLIGTFHAICARILRRYASVVDLDHNFTIADTDVSQDVIKKLKSDPELPIDEFTRTKMTPGAILGMISKAKSKGLTEKQYADLYGQEFATRNVSIIFTAYEKELKRLNLVDFDNLIIKACELFRKKNDVLSAVKAILVDEYQDTNVVQYDLIKLMMQQVNEKSITIVGDPDQSIFGWRSAEPKNFNKMQADYKNTTSISMEQNYRSTNIILKAALHVITQDKTRIDKSLYTNNPEGVPICLIKTRDEDSQAELVAKEIKKVVTYSKGLIQYKDIAVLMRMNFISQQFERAFRNHKIPFTIVGGDRFFDRVEIKDITSYLRFAYNPRDYISFTRIINVPRRGIGKVNLEKIVQYSTTEGINLLEATIKIGSGKALLNINSTIRSKLKAFSQICSEAKQMMNEKIEVSDIIHYLVDTLKYEDYLKEHYFQDYVARWNNIGELINVAKKQAHIDDENITSTSQNSSSQSAPNSNEELYDVEEVNLTNELSEVKIEQKEIEDVDSFEVLRDDIVSTDPIAEFLEYCSLCSNQKELEEAEGGKVTIATLHSSKGLEWPCVFIATCNDGVIPFYRAESILEEGRLLYVGMTRSQFLLYCVSPENRNNWGSYQKEEPSSLLENMDKSLYTAGTSEWNNEIRHSLAKTIGKLPPPDDDDLVISNLKKKSSSKKKIKTTQSGFSYTFHMPEDIGKKRTNPAADLSMFGGFSSAATLYKPDAYKKVKKEEKESSLIDLVSLAKTDHYKCEIPEVKTVTKKSLHNKKRKILRN
ncbi:P-loop containing nucleoside triphosphate hydrolase protein [Cokeromyces recurvatus]|uniref:P-loop containing nucleoside triphosphate hydrolase protein n=1 Tax=Cokeromyces recurvatus TaxID=90255 RepID=UPI00221FB3EE|nr:P-loop containing nucleoside triphosphate hydrolase protein [Cokeromyces recurvatus]KAI7903351.1 P-loop containing nucleoside triphosphate hydrolase protein [Cokeromyces recurvatus]